MKLVQEITVPENCIGCKERVEQLGGRLSCSAMGVTNTLQRLNADADSLKATSMADAPILARMKGVAFAKGIADGTSTDSSIAQVQAGMAECPGAVVSTISISRQPTDGTRLQAASIGFGQYNWSGADNFMRVDGTDPQFPDLEGTQYSVETTGERMSIKGHAVSGASSVSTISGEVHAIRQAASPDHQMDRIVQMVADLTTAMQHRL